LRLKECLRKKKEQLKGSEGEEKKGEAKGQSQRKEKYLLAHYVEKLNLEL
jgi:hypothetical protein